MVIPIQYTQYTSRKRTRYMEMYTLMLKAKFSETEI